MKQEETEQKDILKGITDKEYEYGFVSDIDIEDFPKGLNEEIVRRISQRKGEPDWLLEFRLKAYRYWTTLEEPDWGHLEFEKPNYQDIRYLAIPKKKKQLASMDEVDPELVDTFNKLGINLEEQKVLAGVAVDAVMDSVSVKTTFSDTLKKYGIIFCSFGEAVREHPDLVRQYLGTVVPYTDNFFAALNSAVFSEGSFCYIPKGVRCPIELSTYFRINAANTGQFERTLLIADEGAYVSYMEGCTRQERQGRHLQPRHQARTLQGRELQDFVDAGGDRIGHHVEVSGLYPQGRQQRGRVLLRGRHQQLPAGRHGHEDDPLRPQHPQSDRLQGHLRGPQPEQLPRTRAGR